MAPFKSLFLPGVKDEHFASLLNQAGPQQLLIVGMLSNHSKATMQRMRSKLAEKFHALNHEDEKLPRAEKPDTTIVLGMCVWESKAREKLLHTPGHRTF